MSYFQDSMDSTGSRSMKSDGMYQHAGRIARWCFGFGTNRARSELCLMLAPSVKVSHTLIAMNQQGLSRRTVPSG